MSAIRRNGILCRESTGHARPYHDHDDRRRRSLCIIRRGMSLDEILAEMRRAEASPLPLLIVTPFDHRPMMTPEEIRERKLARQRQAYRERYARMQGIEL